MLQINGMTGEEFTIERLLTDSIRMGNGLRAMGVRKGVVVAIFLPTCPEFVTISLGTMRAGGIVSGANPAYTVFELTNFLEENDARIIFTTGSLLPTVTKASVARGKQIKTIYVVDNPTTPSIKPHTDLLKYPHTAVPCEPIDPAEDLCTLPFSSGTTGRPKGVMVTHRNFVAALVSLGAGYVNRPKETADMRGPDGWLRTGDIGHYDDKKLLYIVDRKKELMKVKGFQVPPAELEDLLLSHPKIADAAVIGIPDERSGEAPRAYIVARGQLSEPEVHRFIDDKVAVYKRLTGGVVFVKEIPKSPSGKILRRLLRDQAKADRKSKL